MRTFMRGATMPRWWRSPFRRSRLTSAGSTTSDCFGLTSPAWIQALP